MVSHQPESEMDAIRLLLTCHRLDKDLASSMHLSVDESHVLTQLFAHSPCCAKELRELLGLEPTRVSKLLGGLEARGCLTRTLGYPDKRKELLSLTPEGRATAQSLLHSALLSLRQVAGQIPESVTRILSKTVTLDDSSVAHP